MKLGTLPQTLQSGHNTPNEGFFDSKNFLEVDHIQRRVQRLEEEAAKHEEQLAAENRRQEKERQDEEAKKSKEQVEGPTVRRPCELCVKAATELGRMDDAKIFKALRRPLAPRCTCMDPTDGGLPVLPIEYPVDIDDWADKPFSTIVSGGAWGYRDHFPLLMQRCTEAEEKDSTQVQTETRRHSIVTTDYLTGRIKLEGTGEKSVHMAVFPVLHAVLSDEDESSSGDEEKGDRVLKTEHSITPMSRRSSIQPPGQQRRRSSLTPGGLPGHGPAGSGGGPRSRVVRRRSIDQSSLALSFARALEAASQAMAPISEDQEGRTASPGEGFDEKHAEETMVHLAHNLHTLEEFLKGASSASSVSSASDSDDDS